MDFDKVYDSTDRKVLIEKLIEYIFPRKLIRLIQMNLLNNKGKVNIQERSLISK